MMERFSTLEEDRIAASTEQGNMELMQTLTTRGTLMTRETSSLTVTMKRSVLICLATLAIIFDSNSLHSQVAVGLRYGQGNGSGIYNVGEITTRLHAFNAFYVTGTFQIIGGHWACPGGDTFELRCGYDGNSISLGAAYAPVDASNIYVAVGGGVGSFLRTGSQDYSGERHFTGNVGVDAEVRVWGPFRIQLGVVHRRIYDDVYSAAFDESPNLTSVTGGLSFVFGSN
jgi:hypothetical protein